MFKIKSAIAAFMITVTMLGAVPAHAVQYVTVADIREETKDGWHETYTYKGEEIRVDADIVIPDIDDVAIVRIKRANDMVPIDEPENANIILGSDGVGFYSDVESEEGVFWGSKFPGVSGGRVLYREDGAQAENSPFSPSDAVNFFFEKLKPYQAKTGHNLQITTMYSSSRAYAFLKADRSGVTYDFDKPLNEMGGYSINASQVFYGVPLVQVRPHFHDMVKSEPIMGDHDFPGVIDALIASDVDYVINYYPAIEEKVLAQSVPLSPFSAVKVVCENLIETGYVRNIFDIHLEYTTMLNPDDIGNTFILVPMWVVSGTVLEKPSAPTPVFSDEEMKVFREGRAATVLINAQTAAYIDPKDISSTRWHGSYITWDEVK